MSTRVAIYARYSSENQRDESIEDQIRLCRARAEREGWTVIETYSDHALSGATAGRPHLQALMAGAARGRYDVVLAEALDRVSRDQEHMQEALQAGPDGEEALDAVRVLIDRIVPTPTAAAKGFDVELVGEIAAMIRLAMGGKEAAGAAGSDLFSSSVKLVAGTGFEPVTFRL